jgi:hypothetical protein
MYFYVYYKILDPLHEKCHYNYMIMYDDDNDDAYNNNNNNNNNNNADSSPLEDQE